MHLACGELHSNTKGETLQYFKLPGGNVTLLSAHSLPDVVLTMTITGLMRVQIFPCDSDMKLKQPVPICSAIFRPLLCGGVYQRSFAKTYLLAKCFTIIWRVHELKKTGLKRTSRRVTKHGRSLPRQSNSSSPFDNEVRVTTLSPSLSLSLCSRSLESSSTKSVSVYIRPILLVLLFALVCDSHLP
jgi:hypothetical protein